MDDAVGNAIVLTSTNLSFRNLDNFSNGSVWDIKQQRGFDSACFGMRHGRGNVYRIRDKWELNWTQNAA